jgi:hypothetical protein
MEMAESAALIRSESARRYVDGRSSRWGVVLLYHDRLASVNVRAELWGCLFGPVVMVAAGWPVTEDGGAFHAIIGVLLGSTIGRFIDRRPAARARRSSRSTPSAACGPTGPPDGAASSPSRPWS